MYIGTIIPWSEFNDPDGTGITYGRLFLLGLLVMAFRRIPSILITYKLMPAVCTDWKEALFMGYFGPIGAGAVFYLEHSKELFPKLGKGDEEETNLIKAITPVVMWLVLFSIIFHGLSIPALNLIYTYMGVQPIKEDSVEIRRVSMSVATPVNAVPGDQDTFIAYNRFSRPVFDASQLPVVRDVPPSREMYPMDGYGDEKDRERRRTIRYAEDDRI